MRRFGPWMCCVALALAGCGGGEDGVADAAADGGREREDAAAAGVGAAGLGGAGLGGAGVGAAGSSEAAGASGSGGRAESGSGSGSGSGGAGAAGGGGAAGAPAGATLIVGVGAWGFRGRSTDGAAWTYCANASTGNDHSPDLLRNVGYGDGVFIAVGGDMNGMVMRSLDGEHWEEDVHPTNACPGEGYPSSCTNWMGAVAYTEGVWLAGGGNGATMRSTDGGKTWKGVHGGFPEKHIRSLTGGGGRFVAGTDGGGIAVTKNNGDAWTKLVSPPLWSGAPSNAVLQIAYGAGTFIAYATQDITSGSRACFISTNFGDSWEPCAASVKANLSFVHDGTQWVTTASGGYATSSDGKTWTTHTASNVPSLLLYDGERWFGRKGGSIYRGDTLDSFAMVASGVSDYRGWTIGRVLASNLPVTGVPACKDNR